MADLRLVNFVREARRRGFDDRKIRESLLSNGWQIKDINSSFDSLKSEIKSKNSLTIWLDSEVLLEELGKRWKLLLRGGVIDFDRTARLVLKDWQSGKIVKKSI